MQPLVPLVFHNLPSLYPPSFRRNDFLYFTLVMSLFPCAASIALQSFPVTTNDTLMYLLGNVDCDGQEAGLSECGYHIRGL